MPPKISLYLTGQIAPLPLTKAKYPEKHSYRRHAMKAIVATHIFNSFKSMDTYSN